MKLSRIALFGILSLSSSMSFAYLQEQLECKSADSQVQLKIEANNCPEFEIDKFDSSSPTDCSGLGTLSTKLTVEGKATQGRVKILSVKDGQKYTFVEPLGGDSCRVSYLNMGMKLKSVVSVGTKPQAMDLECSETTTPPEGSADCDFEALEKHAQD